ncbi:DUF58 domain-containing protein [Frankia sp. AgB1.9]|uniref:DUF58 domain-containing protein n=1 Tax=unclassified Frankia TaxID=2632575 RepID=UPI0019343E53|nr:MULTISPECIES: DUF58 domain-containing protein [unclassified Frankia]MBL7487587.1 DUF58 domain-containing protein [Frankia sp. AgW1.1]MBL7548948.1 DUF58 domain-containing protein [Frankia sp. AgB1.9]MBL7623483.1 DUF58 domain-containing protein [Frankia sp. AgB1.8]
MTRAGVGALAAALLLVVSGVVLRFPELVLLGAAPAAALVTALAARPLRAGVTVTRTFTPARVTEGSPARACLTVVNAGRFRVPPVVAYERVGPIRAAINVPSLAAGGQAEADVPLALPRRGRYEAAESELALADPFRLAGRTRAGGPRTALLVHPATRAVVPLPGRGGDDDSRAAVAGAPDGMTFHSLREYRDGDDWRLIHWPSTARTGQFIVRDTVAPDQGHHVVLLDTSMAPYADDDVFDDAVRFAASWCVAAGAVGAPLTAVTTSGEVASGVGHGTTAPLAALDLLAEARRSPRDQGLAAFRPPAGWDGASTVGIVTGVPARDAMARVAGLLSVVPVVSLVQLVPRGVTPAPTPPGVIGIAADSLDAAARRWNARAGR